LGRSSPDQRVEVDLDQRHNPGKIVLLSKYRQQFSCEAD